DAVKREIKEETGLNVEVGEIIGVFDFTIKKEDYIKDSTQLNFLVKPVGSTDIKLSDEHQNFAWISENEIDKYELSSETKEIIKVAFKS
ncbi:MAG TPA: NUDIX hydrolase, partial [Candidatus Saccharimonadales bacterium]|nr:NUDIX hydrolase [Candidatus Saccharimonadales bacterium]